MPLDTAAAEIVPVTPRTNYFDPGFSRDVTFRYAQSAQNRAFAEDALKSADAIDQYGRYNPARRDYEIARMDREQNTIWDREDEEYNRKKEFEDVRGQYAIELAQLKPDDPALLEKVAALSADTLASEDPFIKSIVNIKLRERDDLQRDQQREAEYEKRFADDIGMTFGVDTASLLGEDGRVDRLKVAALVQGKRRDEVIADVTKEIREEEKIAYGDDLSVVDARDRGSLGRILDDRKKSFLAAAERQGAPVDPAVLDNVVASAGSLTKDMFATQIVKAAGESVPEDATIGELLSASAADKAKTQRIRALVNSAHGLWNAAHKIQGLPEEKQPDPNPKAADFIQRFR